MRRIWAIVATFSCLTLTLGNVSTAGGTSKSDVWAGYLDFAYVYTSAEPAALQQRLSDYGREAGISLMDYVASRFETAADEADEFPETAIRRRAIAYLLDYLSEGNVSSLEASVDAVRELEPRLGRHENRYWYGYVLAHRALEKGHRYDFVGEVLDLWLRVVVPMESPFEALQVLALSGAPNSGFVSALPYLYENVARLVLIRSQQMGMDRDLDPLASVVRLLLDGRVGAHPDVIPVAASSREYLDRVVARLDGPESDAGSLTFTLALFEAAKYHDQARGSLASSGFAPETLETLRLATGAYEAALNRADTLQGQAAVYTRVLRLLGEVYAAKQRLGKDPEIRTPFSVEGAIEVYAELQREGGGEGWKAIGYRRNGRQAYVDGMHGLWEEIQEAGLNAADFYLARSLEDPHNAGEHARNAARIYSRYLAFFHRYATEARQDAVPDSAYFAAHESARGVGDAYLVYSPTPTAPEVELATRRYRSAMLIFPFDRQLWPALTGALERQGRQSEYLNLVRPAAEAVTKSRHVNVWIEGDEPGASAIARLRSALSDSRVIFYLGFADASDLSKLERENRDLIGRRDDAAQRFATLSQQRALMTGERVSVNAGPASQAQNAVASIDPLALREVSRDLSETRDLLNRLDKQIAAQAHALPLFRDTLDTEGLGRALRTQRDHPVHTLLRRMFHENRS
jgi:hypothetical protein